MIKWVKRGLLVVGLIIAIGLSLLGYAYFVEPRQLVVTRAELRIPNFDRRLDGLKVVAISDLHGGSNYVTPERLREIVTLANEQKPDLIVLLGDYVSQIEGNRGPLKMSAEDVAANLRGFTARYGTFAIIGNHDWWYDQAAVTTALESAGITVLDNEIATIEINGTELNIWGIEDLWKHRKVPLEPLDRLSEKRNVVALAHNPDSLLLAPSEISLIFSGHSHGGQVNLPFVGRKAFVNDERFMYGHAVADGKHVYVTGGVGTSVLPLRFRVPPEIAVATLYAE